MLLATFSLLEAPIPVRIVTGNETPPPSATGASYFAWASAMCVAAAIFLVLWRVRGLKRRPPEVRAFELLAQRLSITHSERALIQRMAVINGHISPLSMLVSPSAFERCRQSLETSVIGANRTAIRDLSRKLKS